MLLKSSIPCFLRDNVSTWCEFIPQVIFLNSLFGYLSFLIVFKWATGESTDLYHVLIYMFLSPGQIDPTGYAFPNQGAVQVGPCFVLLIAYSPSFVSLLTQCSPDL